MDMTTLLKIFSSIGENFICSTVQGLHWFFSQMLALFVLETILYIVGSLQGLLTLSFQIKRLLDEITLEKVLIVQYYIFVAIFPFILIGILAISILINDLC